MLAQVCSCGATDDADCFQQGSARYTCEDTNKQWIFDASGATGGIASAVDYTCLEAVPLPSSGINILMQVNQQNKTKQKKKHTGN